MAEHEIRLAAQRLQQKLEILAITAQGNTETTNLNRRYEQQHRECRRRERIERKVTQA